MGALQKALSQVMTRLRDVSVSQKIALLLGGTLVAVSLIWLAQWAASPEMVPLLPQDLQAEELAQIQSALDALGERNEIRGSQIYVSSGVNRPALLAQLHQQNKLPANTSVGFAALVKESDPWISQAEHDRRWIVALQTEIEAVLRQFRDVQSARVFINLDTSGRRWTRREPEKSASVTLIMKQSEAVPRPLAIAAARLVAGAVNGLTAERVQVLDASGAPALDWNLERDPGNVLSRRLAEAERRYTEKIRRQVADPRALISVQAELNSTARNTETREVLKPVETLMEREEETTTTARNREVPGVQPNVGAAIGTGGTDQNHRKERIKTESEPGYSQKREATPAGDVQQVTAAISLSYSYLEGIFRHANPEGETPTEEDIEAIFQQERDRLQPQIAKLVKPQVVENVAISRYFDTALAAAEAEPAGAMDQTISMVQSYGPQTGLALLALLSLGLMLRMARKPDEGEPFGLELGLPSEAIAEARQAADDLGVVITGANRGAPAGGPGPATYGGSPVATGDGAEGEASTVEVPMQQAAATEGVLVAREVDSEMVQISKMVDQIRELSETEPDSVASLVEQWIQKNEAFSEG